MELTLEGISKKVGPQTWLYDMTLAPRNGAVTVLLGATQGGGLYEAAAILSNN